MHYLSYIAMLLWALRYTIHCTTAPLTTRSWLWCFDHCPTGLSTRFAIFQSVTSNSCHRLCLHKNASYIFCHSVAKPDLISLSISADKLISYCETPQSFISSFSFIFYISLNGPCLHYRQLLHILFLPANVFDRQPSFFSWTELPEVLRFALHWALYCK